MVNILFRNSPSINSCVIFGIFGIFGSSAVLVGFEQLYPTHNYKEKDMRDMESFSEGPHLDPNSPDIVTPLRMLPWRVTG